MTMQRREFMATGLAAVAAATTPLGQTKLSRAQFSLEIFFKGQFLHITEHGRLYVSCLNDNPEHPQHSGMVYIQERSLDRKREMPDPDDEVVQGEERWKGWRLNGAMTLLGANGNRIRSPTSPNAGRVSTAAPWPIPPNSDAKWNDPAYLPQLSVISPGCRLKAKWRDECRSFWELDAARLRPRKPCTAAEVVGVWIWRNQKKEATHVSAATDLVSYPVFSFTQRTRLSLKIGLISIPLVIDGYTEIAATCSPLRTNPASRRPYAAGMELSHFHNVFRLLENSNYASMEYLTDSAPPSSVEGTKCLTPFSVRDDDIFCPGGTLPPLP